MSEACRAEPCGVAATGWPLTSRKVLARSMPAPKSQTSTEIVASGLTLVAPLVGLMMPGTGEAASIPWITLKKRRARMS